MSAMCWCFSFPFGVRSKSLFWLERGETRERERGRKEGEERIEEEERGCMEVCMCVGL